MKHTSFTPGSSPLYAVRDSYRISVGGQDFVIGIHGGYNAYGLIGTESNGIFLLSETNKNIVFTEHFCKGMGHDYLVLKQAELNRLLAMDERAFVAFVGSVSPRHLRYNPFVAKTKTPRKLTVALLKKWVKLMDGFDTYDPEAKAEFLNLGCLVAKHIAEKLGLLPEQYSVRPNKGGPAVSGEVYLQTDIFEHGEGEAKDMTALYLCFEVSCMGGGKFYARTCAGLQDRGNHGPNVFYQAKDLLRMDTFLKHLCNIPQSPALMQAIDLRQPVEA